MPEFLQHHWGDLASVIGLAVTIVTLLKVRSVAAATKASAEETKNKLSQIDTLSDISAAITMMDEIKRLHRTKGWNVLLERYSALRRLLLSIQAYNPGLASGQKTILSAAVNQFRVVEETVEKACAASREVELDTARFNRIVSRQIDDLEQLLIAIKQVGV